MIVWILYYEGRAEINKEFVNQLIKKGISSGMDISLVYVEDLHQMLEQCIPDAVIARMINPNITKLLESHNIRVFNNYETAYMCNNKAATIEAVHNINITHIPTIVVSEIDGILSYRNIYSDTDYYNEKIDEIEINQTNASYSEYVIKSVSGHGGKEVMLLDDFINNKLSFGNQESQASECYSDKYIIQPLIQCNGRDLRVYIIGKRIIGAVLRQSVTGFKSNFSLGGNVSLYELSPIQEKIINKIIDYFSFDYVGIDFLIDENDNLIFNEIEDVVGARMLSECSDIDYAGLYINYIKFAIDSKNVI